LSKNHHNLNLLINIKQEENLKMIQHGDLKYN